MASSRRTGSLESVGSQCRDHFVNLEHRIDRDVAYTRSQGAPSFHSEQTGQHEESNHSHDEEVHSLEKKVERLHQRLHRRTRIREDRTPSLDQYSSTGSDKSYQPRSRTPPSESFTSLSRHSSGRDRYHKKSRTPPRRGQGQDAMGKALLQISHSLFSQRIEQAELPCRFNQPTFTIYNGKTDPVKHSSHLNQRMTIHSKNKALMCKVFPSSLRPVAMRWFDSLEEGSIHSDEELTKAFGARFVTYSQVPKPLDSLLSMSMRKCKTLKNYFDRY